MSSQKESVSEKLLALLNPTPVHADPEADIYEETTAKVVDKDSIDNDSDDETLSLFRKQNASLIEESDERYKGKKISRKKFVGSNWEESGSDSGGEEENLESRDGSEDADSDHDEVQEELSGTDSEAGEDLSGVEVEDSELDADISVNQTQSEENSSFQHFSKQNASAEVEKGTAIRNQLNLCDSLLESRIQLQKSLAAANRFPRLDIIPEFQSQGGNTFSSAIKQTKRSITSLLDKLLELRSEKLQLFSETRGIGEKKSSESDESITSSSEDEEKEEVEKASVPNPKRRRIEDYATLLSTQHQQFTEYRNTTLQKWNDKTRVSLGKVNSRNFSAFEQSTVRQIEQTMINRQRLVGRTQLKRTPYRVLGTMEVAESAVPQDDTEMETMEDKSKELDLENFNDDDFYHTLLRELIERKAADVTDPMRLGRQWLELQKVRSKMKRKIDMRATKGRKIRYTEHAKLVNFMAPVAEIEWNNEARVELYNSLFGKM